MIPIRDNIRSRTTPGIMYLLILVNAYVFYLEITSSNIGLQRMIQAFGLTPRDFLRAWHEMPANPFVYLPLVSNLFLHGGWLHIIGNLWYLKIFGDNIEDRIGHGNFLLFYLLCGIAANLVQVLVEPSSRVPTIGASGAISGVLGAYLLCFPRAKVSTLVPIFIIITFIDIPAVLFLGFWFLLQLQSGAVSLFMAGSNVAWWAHIGGFVAGMALIQIFPRRSLR